MTDRPESWTPPPLLPRRPGIRGAFGGSRLFELPRQQAELRRFERFIGGARPLVVEVGFDHGHRLLDHARRWPETCWLGLELRKARVLALRAQAPENLLAWRADARTVFSRLMPAARAARVDILFPTPWWDEGKRARRLLLSAAFIDDLARTLAPGGVVQVVTDVGPYFEHVEALFARWQPVEAPPSGDARSHREWLCARDDLRVWRGCWSRPAS